MFVDSHCHINFPELAAELENVLAAMASNGVSHALCVSVTLEAFPEVRAVAERFANVFASAGVHPDTEAGEEPVVALPVSSEPPPPVPSEPPDSPAVVVMLSAVVAVNVVIEPPLVVSAPLVASPDV